MTGNTTDEQKVAMEKGLTALDLQIDRLKLVISQLKEQKVQFKSKKKEATLLVEQIGKETQLVNAQITEYKSRLDDMENKKQHLLIDLKKN